MNVVDVAAPRIAGLSDFRKVGAGGFGVTYAAYEADQDRTVAVKVLHEADEAGRRRFDRERRTMGNTTGHPNIVTLFRSGFTDDSDQPYLVMEYLAGGSLEDRIERSGWLPVAEAVDLIAPVAEALGFSHAHGILHKDVKPANILVSESGVAKLTDFGIAALKESSATSQVAYSPAYAPPESFDTHHSAATGDLADPRDERSDLYSLAATFYHLVIGAPPFAGTPLSLMRQIADAPVPATGDDGLDRFLAVAMAKNPEHRHQSADAFVEALRRIGDGPGPLAHSDTSRPTRPVAPAHSGPGPSWTPASAPAVWGHSPATSGPGPAVWGHGPATSGPGPAVWGHGPATSGPAPAPGFAPPQPWPGQGPQDLRRSGPGPEPVRVPVGATSRSSARGPIVIGAVAGMAVLVAMLGAVFFVSASSDDAAPAFDDVEPTTTEGPAAPSLEPLPAGYAGHSEDVRNLVALPDGRVLSTSLQQVRVWDPDELGQTDVRADEDIFQHYEATLLPDGRLATAAGAWVNIWDVDDPEFRVDSFDNPVSVKDGFHVAVLADGRVASDSEATIYLWDPADPSQPSAVYDGHSDSIRAMAGLPNGWVVSAGITTIHVWNPADPTTTIAIYEGHDTREQLEAIANSVNSDDPPRAVPVAIKDIVVLPDGRVVSSAIDGFENLVHIWDPTDLDRPVVTRSVPDGVTSLLVLEDGRIVEGRDSGAIAIWHPDLPTAPDAEYTGHDGAIRDLVELADGRIVSAGDGGPVRIWDPTCTEADTSPVVGLTCLRRS